jgi:Tfp pilus assembly protein PilV
MLVKRFKEESGYSLVEVMVSILILTIAILPMVSMFDMGLNTAGRGTNYDRARTLANTKLEQAKMLPYETVKSNFPSEAASNMGAPVGSNSITSSSVTSARDLRVPQGFCYVVTKQYLKQPTMIPGTSSEAFTPSPDGDADTGLLKVTVRVSWRGDLDTCNTNPYQTSGAVAE